MATINIVFFITTDFLGDSGKEYHNGKKNTGSGSSTGTIDYVSLSKLFDIQCFSFVCFLT